MKCLASAKEREGFCGSRLDDVRLLVCFQTYVSTKLTTSTPNKDPSKDLDLDKKIDAADFR